MSSEPLVARGPEHGCKGRKPSASSGASEEQLEHPPTEDQPTGHPPTRQRLLHGRAGQAGWLLKLGKFLVVGGIGVGVNSAALFLLYQICSLPLVLASLLATELSIVSNYYWNDRWTFGQRWPSWGRFGKFNLVALGGLFITTLTLWGLVTRLNMPYLFANLLGVLLATSWNFVVNVFWTWGVSCL